MGNTIEPCVHVKSEFSRTYYAKSADGSTKYRNESESREMTFYGGSKTVPPVSINVKGEALRGIWGVSGGLSTSGSPEFFKSEIRENRSVYYKETDETDCFFALDTMVYIINHQFKQVLL